MGRVIFTDFDGTITKTDTCYAMVKNFALGDWEEINRLWENKKLSTVECANQTFRMFRARPGEVQRMLRAIEIDDFFLDFVKLAQGRGDRVIVLSDGYDLSIRTIFRKYGISLPYYANRLRYDGGYHIGSGYANPECSACGTCKRSLMETLKKDGETAVYIGDGASDFCAAQHADIVFAKGTLLRYCKKNGIAASAFEDFGEVSRALGYEVPAEGGM